MECVNRVIFPIHYKSTKEKIYCLTPIAKISLNRVFPKIINYKNEKPYITINNKRFVIQCIKCGIVDKIKYEQILVDKLVFENLVQINNNFLPIDGNYIC